MKSLASYRIFLNLTLLLLFCIKCIQSLESESNSDDERSSSRTGRANLIALKPFGESLNVGLEVLLPFVRVPTKRALNGEASNEALLTVNTAAVTAGGLISGIGIFIAHILRSLLTLRGSEDDADLRPVVESKNPYVEHRLDFDSESVRTTRALDPIKLHFRNSSGDPIETSFTELVAVIENNFLEKNVDLSACMQKAMCSLVQRSSINMANGAASGLEKMIDGILQLNWITQLAQKTAVENAILAGKSNSNESCSIKYATCKWENPESQLYEFIKKNVKFV